MIVLLAGAAGSGKDTAGAWFGHQGWTRVAFADSVRKFAYTLNPWVRLPHIHTTGGILEYQFIKLRDLVDREGWDVAKQRPEIREILQDLGTECGRDICGKDVWVNAAFRPYLEYKLHRRLYITDTRFANEYYGAKKFAADRNSNEVVELVLLHRLRKRSVRYHSSENLSWAERIANWNISNESTIEDLHKTLEQIYGAKAGAV